MKNEPKLWIKSFPTPKEDDHKYNRGQVVVLGGTEMTGAACLCADSAARAGAGLVTIIPHQANKSQLNPLLVYRCFKPYIIARDDFTMSEFVRKAKDKGRVCPIAGSGLGNKKGASSCAVILSLLGDEVPVVLDADGLNVFEGNQDSLWAKTHADVVLTPHDGEFKRLFPDLAPLLKSDRLKAAQEAASRSNTVVVLKGAKTIITAPDRDTIINDNAQSCLASAGTGDVLSGLIAGLIAQGMNSYEASAAAVWMHGRASEIIGVGLVATDIIEKIPTILKEMLGIYKKLG